jgi:hypothetical protein
VIIVNNNGYSAIGNRYFGGKNAAEYPRAYNRITKPEQESAIDIFIGNRTGTVTQTVQNGLVQKSYNAPPELSADIYARGQNILQRMADIAKTVGDDTTISNVERAKYDAEFQQLKQQLKDSGIGNTPTAAASAAPQNAALENLQLVSDSSNVLTTSAASTAATGINTGYENLYAQQGGKQLAELNSQSVARTAYFDSRRELDIARDQTKQLQSQIMAASSRQYAYSNPTIEKNQFRANVLNLFA